MSTTARQIIYRPRPPVLSDGTLAAKGMEFLSGVYLVMQQERIVAAYHPTYFLSAREVVADFIQLIRAGDEEWNLWDDDYVVWIATSSEHRVLAVIRWRKKTQNEHVTFFDERRKHRIRPWPGWPTYDEWVASGRGDLWWTEGGAEANQEG
jgi:hypothetical protein